MRKARKAKIAIGVSFLLCFLCICIGYAQLSDTLNISGDASVDAPDGVFITNVIAQDSGGVVNKYINTALNTTTNLGTNKNNTVTYTVYLRNNAPYAYAFNGVTFIEEAYDNTDIVFELSGLANGAEIQPDGGTLSFQITFEYAVSKITNTVLNSTVNFDFILASEYIPEAAADGAVARFGEILNTPEDMNKLLTQMDKSVSGRNDDSYIGNVVGSVGEDSAVINELFTVNNENALVLNIAGEETNVTAMIKRENLDGNTSTGDESGDEITIYMTADDPTQYSWYARGNVKVFAAVFTRNSADGEWYQLGEMYEGQAQVNNYSGNNLFNNPNSFDTDTWKSTQVYHGAAAGSTIDQIVSAYKLSQ